MPPLMMMCFLAADEWLDGNYSYLYFLIMVAGVVVGLFAIYRLPFGELARISIAIIYVPTMLYLLLIFSLSFVCMMYGSCL
jgi:hypothetical protein